VEVPGGSLTVILDHDTSYLRGPAVIIAAGDLMLAE
jgi:diaminopimelate epimerase